MPSFPTSARIFTQAWPVPVLPPCCLRTIVTPSDHEPDACGGSLFYTAGVHADRIGRLDVDTGEHHVRPQAEVAAASSQLLRLRRGSVGCNDGHTIRFLLLMGSAQTTYLYPAAAIPDNARCRGNAA